VQVDPIKHTLKATGTERLKLECDELLSSFAFEFNLRHYIVTAHPRVTHFLWIDADAVVLDHSYDLVARLASQHPGKELIGCREAGAHTRPLYSLN
jgi:hypothetical protein